MGRSVFEFAGRVEISHPSGVKVSEGIGRNEVGDGGGDHDAEVWALIPAHALGATDRTDAAAVEALVARDRGFGRRQPHTPPPARRPTARRPR